MKSLSAFINEEIVAPTMYADDTKLNPKTFIKDLNKYSGLMPNVKHCSVSVNPFGIVGEQPFFEVVVFNTANKNMNVFAFIESASIGEEEYNDKGYNGYLYSVTLFVGMSVEKIMKNRINNYRFDAIRYSADGNYEQFLKDLCLLVNDYIDVVGQVFDDYDSAKTNSTIAEFATNHRKYSTLEYERIERLKTEPVIRSGELIKVF